VETIAPVMKMLRVGLLFAAAVSVSAACGAMAQSANNPGEGAVANACAGLGLNPSEAPYIFCKMSLEDSVAAVAQARAIDVARRACAHKGYRVGTASFANCVLDREESVENQPPAALASTAEDLGHSYQRGDQRRSVPRACAQLGLDPGSPAFSSCVSNLNMTLDDSNMVGGD
jgi:hypothetical protein